MEIRRYKIFEWDAVLIYLLPFLLLVAGTIFTLAKGLPARAILANAATAAAWGYAGVFRYFGKRYKDKRDIAWYTKQGLKVYLGGSPASQKWLRDRKDELDRQIDQALAFWTSLYPSMRKDIEESLNGGSLVVKITNSGFTAPSRAGMAVVREAGILPMRGATEYPNYISVAWEPKNEGRDFFALVRHEAGHGVLNTFGFDGDHHAEMRRLQSPDA